MEDGADAIHPVQALAAGMDVGSLKESFRDAGTCCGPVDPQNLLMNGAPAKCGPRGAS